VLAGNDMAPGGADVMESRSEFPRRSFLQEASEDRRRSAGVDQVPIRQPRTDPPLDHFGFGHQESFDGAFQFAA